MLTEIAVQYFVRHQCKITSWTLPDTYSVLLQTILFLLAFFATIKP